MIDEVKKGIPFFDLINYLDICSIVNPNPRIKIDNYYQFGMVVKIQAPQA